MFLKRVTEMSAKTSLYTKDSKIICVGKDLGGEYVLMRGTEKPVCRETIYPYYLKYIRKIKGDKRLFNRNFKLHAKNISMVFNPRQKST